MSRASATKASQTLRLLALSLVSLLNAGMSWQLIVWIHNATFYNVGNVRVVVSSPLVETIICLCLFMLHVLFFNGVQKYLLSFLGSVPDGWLWSVTKGSLVGALLSTLFGSLMSVSRDGFYNYLFAGWVISWVFSGFWSGLVLGQKSKHKLIYALMCSLAHLCWYVSGLIGCLILQEKPPEAPVVQYTVASFSFLIVVIVLPSIIASALNGAVLRSSSSPYRRSG